MTAAVRKLLAVSGLVLITAIWGSSYLIMKRAIAEIGVAPFLFLRFLLAFALMAAIFHRRLLRATRPAILSASVLGLLFALIVISQSWGLRFTNAANSALITSLYMPLIPIASALFLRVRANAYNIAGILLALAGMVLLTSHNLAGFNRGDALTIVCAVVSAAYIIVLGRIAHRHDIAVLVAVQCLVVAALSGTASATTGWITFNISPFVWGAVVFTALFVTVMARIIQTAAQRIVSPSRAGLILSLEAVFGAAIAWTFGRESVTPLSFMGACMMVLGVFVSEIPLLLRAAKRRPLPSSPDRP